jgi:hypothetical protein
MVTEEEIWFSLSMNSPNDSFSWEGQLAIDWMEFGYEGTRLIDDGGTGGGGDPTAPVPEPVTMLLFGTGLVGLIGSRICKNRKN